MYARLAFLLRSVEHYYTGKLGGIIVSESVQQEVDTLTSWGIDTSVALQQEVAALVQYLPNLRNLIFNVHFSNSTSTSSDDPEVVAHNFEKRLGPSLATIRNVTVHMNDDGFYGDEVDECPQPSVWEIAAGLQRRLPKVKVRSHGWETDHEWVAKIFDLEHPIMLMGKEHPAKPRQIKPKKPAVVGKVTPWY
ncbi:MAG: hypothetical protein Q9170_004794 [Blastenia crenularia]